MSSLHQDFAGDSFFTFDKNLPGLVRRNFYCLLFYKDCKTVLTNCLPLNVKPVEIAELSSNFAIFGKMQVLIDKIEETYYNKTVIICSEKRNNAFIEVQIW